MNVDETTRVLDYWLCLEFLSPQKLPKANAKLHTWHASLDRDLPWIDRRKMRLFEETKKGKIWRHSITFGVINLRGVLAELKKTFALEDQAGDESLRIPDHAAILTINADSRGHPIGSVSFSSLPWAMGRLTAAGRSGSVDFSGFSGQGGFEEAVKATLYEHLVSEQILEPDWIDDKGRKRRGKGLRPLGFSDFRKLENLLFEKCGWYPGGLLRATVCTKGFRTHPNNRREADSDILNSFHTSDILRERFALAEGGRARSDIAPGLRSYFQGVNPTSRIDIRREGIEQAYESTMPAMMPLARWPSKHPLAFAQQFAVNRIMCDLDGSAGLFSVNGPPGTGKTTLLRDIVAAVVFRRAETLACLAKPTDAFPRRSAVRNTNGEYVWTRTASLSGYGIVVASSNNGAVENISKELPTRNSIDAPGVSIDYFAAVGDGLIAEKNAERRKEGAAWGIIAAVLGNRENCSRFDRRFWGRQVSPADEGEEPEDHEDDEGGNPSEDADLIHLPMMLQAEEAIEADEQDPGFIGFEAALEATEAKPWAEAVEAFLLVRRRVSSVARDAQRRAEALNKLFRAEATVLEAEMQHNDAASAVQQQAAQHELVRTALANGKQELDATSTRKRLVRTLQEKGERFASIEAVRFGKSAEEIEQHLQTNQAEVRRLAESIARVSIQIEHEKFLRPGWIARIFRRARSRAWDDRFTALIQEQRSAGDTKAALELTIAGEEKLLREIQRWQSMRSAVLRERDEALAAAKTVFGSTIPSVGQADRDLADARRLHERATRAEADCRASWDTAKRALSGCKAHLDACLGEVARLQHLLQKLGVTDTQRKFWNLRSVDDETRQRRAPWHDEDLWRLRHEAFTAALDLHKSFLRANQRQVIDNLKFLSKVITGAETERGISIPMQHLWDTLFLTVPVVSTAFASVPRLFAPLGAEALGWLIIDEAGQATPQAALGSIWRARRSVVVGDPLQIEPVVPIPAAAIEMIRQRFDVGHQWHPVANSAQVLADRANRWGTVLNSGTEGLWIGSPLRVHRRCIDPMFTVANKIAYNGMMVYGTMPDKNEKQEEWPGESAWIDVGSEGAEGHWIPAQGDWAARIAYAVIAKKERAFTEDKANVYIITPFKAAADGIKALLQDRRSQGDPAAEAARHADRITGTVHTFQGKEADVVVIMLCGDPERPGARSSFAARAPNLLNVALTRAKRRIYVIGDYGRWSKEKYFDVLAANVRRITPKSSAVS